MRAGELDTLLLRWEEGWLPGLRPSSREGAGDGLSGMRSWNPSTDKNPHTFTLKICFATTHSLAWMLI